MASHPTPACKLTRQPSRVLCYFLVSLVVVDVVVNLYRDLWQTYAPDDYTERLHGCQQRQQDIIAIGGSPVSEGIDPSFLTGLNYQGHTCEHVYALGLPGGTASEFWHALKHGAPQPPRLLIYGITASDLNDRRQELHGMASLMDWDDLRTWVTTRPSSAEYAARHFLRARLSNVWQLARYRNGLRLCLADHAEQVLPGSFTRQAGKARANREYTEAMRSNNGYAPNARYRHQRYDEYKRAGNPAAAFGFLGGYRITGGHIGCLNRMLDWANERGTKVILVDMPVTDDLQRQYVEAFDSYHTALTQLESERGVIVLRASREALGVTNRHFSDLIHLNKDGADSLSAWIRAKLGEM